MRFFKYLLISVFSIVLFSVVAFAADSPIVATVNGYGYASLDDALAVASSGDNVSVVSDTSVSSVLTVPSGVFFNVPSGVTINFDSSGLIISYGNCSLNGNFVSSTSSSWSLFNFAGGNSVITGNFYSSSGTNSIAIPSVASSDTVVSIFNGYFEGSIYGISNYLTSDNLIVYGGEFIPSIYGPYSLGSGSFIVPGESGVVISFGPLYQIGQIVSSAISWLGLFIGVVVSNKLLLIFVIIIFVGVGIGLIKRVIN